MANRNSMEKEIDKSNVLIVTALQGYTVDDIRPWIESLSKCGYTGNVLAFKYDDNKEVEEYLTSYGVSIYPGVPNGLNHVATQRFADYAVALGNEALNHIEYVLHTDIRDVIFQEDPTEWIKNGLENHQILVSAEGTTYNHEDWNGDGLQKHFGKEMFEEFKNYETLCSGVIAGRKEAIAELFITIFEMSFFSGSPDGFNDQHFHNIAIRKVFKEITNCPPADAPWTANLGTLIAIPYSDPNWSSTGRTPYNSYERFRKGTFVENMLVDLPQMIDGKVCTPNGIPYAIVHQYDRYQPWKESLLNELGVSAQTVVDNTTVVTALYDLKRENWSGFSRPFEEYKNWMRSVLSFDSPMVIFVDPSDVEFVEEMRKDKSDKTKIIPLKFSELVTNVKYGKDIVSVMNTKEFLENQTVPNHPQIKYPDYNILMHEKVQFVKRAIDENNFNTENYMWLDAGVYHMNNRVDLINKKFPKLNITDNKIHLIYIDEPKDSDLELEQFYKGHNVRIIGTSWGGNKDAITEFVKEYENLLEESISKNLMDQDQSFLTVCALRRPDICELHKGNWSSALNFWS